MFCALQPTYIIFHFALHSKWLRIAFSALLFFHFHFSFCIWQRAQRKRAHCASARSNALLMLLLLLIIIILYFFFVSVHFVSREGKKSARIAIFFVCLCIEKLFVLQFNIVSVSVLAIHFTLLAALPSLSVCARFFSCTVFLDSNLNAKIYISVDVIIHKNVF